MHPTSGLTNEERARRGWRPIGKTAASAEQKAAARAARARHAQQQQLKREVEQQFDVRTRLTQQIYAIHEKWERIFAHDRESLSPIRSV